jgi:hypothetical protein
MSETARWLEDARIPERMHAQGLPLDMMLSVDRGSDAVVLRVTTRHLTREEARELGSRLIEAALLSGEREAAAVDVRTIPELPVRIVDQDGSHFTLVGGDYRLVLGDGIGSGRYTMAEIRDGYGVRKLHYADGRAERPS